MAFNKQETLREIARSLTVDGSGVAVDFTDAEIGEDSLVIQVNPTGEPSYDVKITVDVTEERTITSFEEPTA